MGRTSEICRDHACTVAVTSFDAVGASGAPSANLPAGVLFWRAYGRSGGATGTQTTPTWEMIVGARTAPINTSWGTTLDVNGDGYADVIVGAFGACKAYLYLGSTGGLQPSATLNCPDPTGTAGGNNFGLPVASAGDVNGDGYADIVVD